MIDYVHSLFGLMVLTAIPLMFSEDRHSVRPKAVLLGLAVQITLAFILLKLPFVTKTFAILNTVVSTLQQATDSGASFVFGYLGGASPPFIESAPEASFVLAFRILPLVLVVSALSSLLFYWRVMPLIVNFFSKLLQKSLRIGGALGVGTAANIFVGMIEAPLFIRPYLKSLTRSELFTIMTCGMATIAGTVMVLYGSILQGVIPNAMGHILIASIISAPAAITVSRIMVPETRQSTEGSIALPQSSSSSMDAITKGTSDGISLLINIAAMLLVLVALVSLANHLLGLLPDLFGSPVSLERLLGYIMAPIVWLTGVSWHESLTAGSLMGTKTVMNELLAYLQLSNLPEGALSPRSELIMIYAMCGFANFGSLGIMIGGLGSIEPDRREEIVSLGLKSIIAGTIATCMTGSIVGLLY